MRRTGSQVLSKPPSSSGLAWLFQGTHTNVSLVDWVLGC